MSVSVHHFRFDPRFRLPARLLSITDERAWVRVDDDQLEAAFGPWRVRTPTANIASASITGPYRWPKVIGPPHLSFADRGLTFATNATQGVCIEFRQPIHGIDPFGRVAHPNLTVTVDDCAALAELLAELSTARSVDQATASIHDHLIGLSAAELRGHARERGLPRVSAMSKAELMSALTGSE